MREYAAQQNDLGLTARLVADASPWAGSTTLSVETLAQQGVRWKAHDVPECNWHEVGEVSWEADVAVFRCRDVEVRSPAMGAR